jgi:hypothetical protein
VDQLRPWLCKSRAGLAVPTKTLISMMFFVEA